MADHPAAPTVALDRIKLSFGAVKALRGVDFRIMPGEVVGLVGHNGAGKSTLMNVLAGNLKFNEGEFRIAGRFQGHRATNADSRLIGSVSQELLLAPNLTVAENARILHRQLVGFGWRRRAADLMQTSLDAIFPDHGIRPTELLADLPIAKRQMVEIARAFADPSLGLVILDEPTSSLDGGATKQLLSYIRKRRDEGLSIVLISHRLGEIFAVCDRAVVMRDGLVVEDAPIASLTRNELVEAMGHGEPADSRLGGGARRQRAGGGEQPCIAYAAPRPDAIEVKAVPGEVVGLAGLAGHGQTEFLHELVAGLGIAGKAKRGNVAFVAGDRRADGIFPVWSVEQNLTIRAMNTLARFGFLSAKREHAMAAAWKDMIDIRAASVDTGIMTLSGGNQQKVLFARALGSDASIILMDDPMRGVDVGTKQEVYRRIHEEAGGGRCFVWYTTEMDELYYCDRVYVFRQGFAVAEFKGSDITESSIVGASFAA